jgi:hypothetical protein
MYAYNRNVHTNKHVIEIRRTVSELCPSSRILNTKKYVLETGSVALLR